VDQTRGWFYSLHAISTLLFDEPCFLNCVCLGLILDGEGYKMSKSRGNVVDPWEVLNAHGADALRWYLFTATPPGTDRRFSVNLVGEVVRQFLLTLWNTYSFFVTYANIDEWTPAKEKAEESASPLDRWILSELHILVKRVTAALDAYDVTGAARPIAAFVDDLSNWYVRRSRRRFWKSEEDADKLAAYQTLYECLVTVAKLLAPFMPFIAEELYQNLVRSVDEKAPKSVHHSDFPVADESLIDEKLVRDTQLVMRVVSLGHGARNRAGIKVRQPLAQALVKTREAAEVESLNRLADQVVDELNTKELVFLEEASQVVDYQLSPVPSLLGKKHGALFPKIRAAVAGMDAAATMDLARRLQADQSVEVVADGQTVTLLPEEVEVQLSAKEGYAVVEEAGYLVAVATELSEDLVQEGLAREIVRRIQIMRKEADFRIEDYITAYYRADPTLCKVLEEYGDYIKQETLSTALIEAEAPAEDYVQTLEIDGRSITLAVRRN
jgi:isoleucyl-tRNA synthetase